MKTIVILSALEENERQILLSYLPGFETILHPTTGTDYYLGYYNIKGVKHKIILGRTDQTNVNAGIETERAINFFKPSYIFFAGVAGGLKDVKVGDIVIGQDVYGYERGKADKEKKGNKIKDIYKPRPKFGASSYALVRAATNFAKSETWQNIAASIVDVKFHKKVQVLTGTIAAGEKVNASLNSDLSKFLKQNCSHALAIEMEGIGFLEACWAYPEIQSLLIRGISDLVYNKSDSDKKGSQEYASKILASFVFSFLNTLDVDIELTRIETLIDILCKLYPEGIKDGRIWVRAGGDLSKIQLQNTGFIQWFDAIDLISKGGGGNIDFHSLIEVMKSDFPKNNFLKTLVIDS
jgi:nucleoside phosphorylase